MIGIFDSGIGGLTVARAVERLLPYHSLLYFGDTARTPYGPKSPEVIIDYSLRNAEFLLSKGATFLVIGCNSASSVATERLRQEFAVPVFEVVGPAAITAAEVSQYGRIGVIGTRATINSRIYEQTIRSRRPECQIVSVACPLLVPLVEEGWLNKRETKMIIRRYLQPFKNAQIDTLILGCTHYPMLKELVQSRVGRKVKLIDSSVETALALQRQLNRSDKVPASQSSPAVHRFYFSDITDAASKAAQAIFGRPVEILTP